MYDFFDYVWDNLNNKSHPKIIWHKTHVMPLRDLVSTILHDVQTNEEESVTARIQAIGLGRVEDLSRLFVENI